MNVNIVKRREFKILLLLVMLVCAPLMNVRTASAATKTTTKVSTKTTKLKSKSKAKKSYSKTSSKTTTKKSTSSTASQKTVKTVKTTVKTTNKYTKGSKVYKHTVKTTVKTTTTTTAIKASSGNSASSTSTTTASQTSGSGNNPYTYYMGKADTALVNAFETLGFSVQVKSGVSYSGYFDAAAQTITLKSSTDDTILHELGHFLSFVSGNSDATSEFASIYTAEKSKYTKYNAAYVTQNASEYFAESYRDYVNDPAALKTARPLTYAYLQKCLEKVTDSQVKKIATLYASVWK